MASTSQLPSLEEAERGTDSGKRKKCSTSENCKSFELGHELVNSYVILICCSNKAIIFTLVSMYLLTVFENNVIILSLILVHGGSVPTCLNINA